MCLFISNCIISLRNLIEQQNLATKKNPKATELKDLMAEEGDNLKLMWVPAHTIESKEMKKLTRLQSNLLNKK
jgi:hypothetical protein